MINSSLRLIKPLTERMSNKGYWKSEFKETALTFPHKVLHKIKSKSLPQLQALLTKYIPTTDAHVDEIWNCQWSPNGELLATGGKDARLIIWNVVIKGTIAQIRFSPSMLCNFSINRKDRRSQQKEKETP